MNTCERRPVDRQARMVLVWAVLVAVLAGLPAWIAAGRAGETTFIGSLAPYAEDATYHLSFVAQARRGAVLLEDKYNGARIRTRLVLNIWFLVAGVLGRWLGLSLAGTAMLARFLAAAGLVLAAERFGRVFLARPLERFFHLLVFSFAAGSAWLLPAIGSTDGTALEVVPFAAMADDLIVPVTTALLLLTFALLLESLEPGREGRAYAAGAAALALGLVHPHDLAVTVYSVGGAWVALGMAWPGMEAGKRGEQGRGRVVAARLLAMSAPALAYHAWVLWREPLFWHYVSLDDSLSLGPVLAGFGPLLVIALAGAALALREGRRIVLFPCLWFILALALLKVPVPPCGQFFLLHGLPAALAVTAAIALARLWRAIGGAGPRRALAWAVVALLVLPCASGNLVHLRRWRRLVGERPEAYFLPAPLAAAMGWMAAEVGPESVLLAGPSASRAAPAFAGVRVLAGQPQQTVAYEERRAEVAHFFGLEQAEAAEAFLRRNGVRLVYLGAEERALGGGRIVEILASRGALRLAWVGEGVTVWACS